MLTWNGVKNNFKHAIYANHSSSKWKKVKNLSNSYEQFSIYGQKEISSLDLQMWDATIKLVFQEGYNCH